VGVHDRAGGNLVQEGAQYEPRAPVAPRIEEAGESIPEWATSSRETPKARTSASGGT
jgi:hypothetical protein